MFIATLFIIAETWEQPKCPPIDESTNCGTVVPSYPGGYTSTIPTSQMPEFMDNTTLYIHYTFPYTYILMIKFSL
jgi:hypothetical protein